MLALKSQLKSSGTRAAVVSRLTRQFSSTLTRSSGGGHDEYDDHEEAPEERLADNPLYLNSFFGFVAGAAIIGTDQYYKSSHDGLSFFAQWIHPVENQVVVAQNTAYQERTLKDAQFYQVMYTQPIQSGFRDLETVQTIRKGSTFNREPGSSLNLDTLGPRRQIKRSLFD